MIISLLHIVVPTILILAILIPYINSRTERVKNEIRELRAQLEKLDNVPEHPAEEKPAADSTPAREPDVPAEKNIREKADKDAEKNKPEGIAASEYNTGKSGKIYTEEELELLIKG